MSTNRTTEDWKRDMKSIEEFQKAPKKLREAFQAKPKITINYSDVPYAFNNKQVAPHKCPICSGVGVVSNGFYSVPYGQSFMSSSTAPEQCRTCGGRGVIWK